METRRRIAGRFAAIGTAVLLASVLLIGCSHGGNSAVTQRPGVSVAANPGGGSVITTSSGQLYIPAQAKAELPKFKVPSDYLASMLARDQAKTGTNH